MTDIHFPRLDGQRRKLGQASVRTIDREGNRGRAAPSFVTDWIVSKLVLQVLLEAV